MSQQPTGSDQQGSRAASIDAEIARFRDRLKTDPASLAFLPLSEALRKAGKLDEAKAVCLQGLGHHPDYISGQVVLARILSDAGDRIAAREVLEKIVEATPDHLLANKLLAQNYLLSGMSEKARGRLGTVVMLNPGDEEAVAALATLDRQHLASPAPSAAVPPEAPAAPFASPAVGPEADAFESAAPILEPPVPVVETAVPAFDSASLVEEVSVEGESDDAEGPFMEFGGLSGIDDVEEIGEIEETGGGVEEWEAAEPVTGDGEETAEIPEPAVAEPSPQVEMAITLPGLSEEDSAAPVEEITSETLADLYLSQDLPDRAIRIYRELLVEEPGNERISMKLARALASQRAAASPVQAPMMEAPRVARPVERATSGGKEGAAILIARLEEWLTTIGERRRGIH